jgi:hypothetical protein
LKNVKNYCHFVLKSARIFAHIEHRAQILNSKLEILNKFKIPKYEGSKRGKCGGFWAID